MTSSVSEEDEILAELRNLAYATHTSINNSIHIPRNKKFDSASKFPMAYCEIIILMLIKSKYNKNTINNFLDQVKDQIDYLKNNLEHYYQNSQDILH